MDAIFDDDQRRGKQVKTLSSCEERIAQLEAENAELRMQIEHLETALDAAGVCTWIWEPGKDHPEWDARMRSICGLRDGEAVTNELFLNRLHPEDRDVITHDLVTISEGQVEWPPKNIVQSSYRIAHPDLGERWISCWGNVTREAAGRIDRISGVTIDFTAAKLTENALRHSEEKYRRMYESISEPFARVALNGQFLEFNTAYHEMLGYTREELLNINIWDITPEKWHQIEISMGIDKLLVNETTDFYEKEYQRKDGTVFPVELRVFLLRDADGKPESLWALTRDITARKANETAMREWNETLENKVKARTLELLQSESRYRLLADASFEGVCVSENGAILDGNSQFATMWGYSISEMIGLKVHDLIAPLSLELVRKNIESNNEQPYEFMALRKDGSIFPAMVRGRKIEWQGKWCRVSALRDLSGIRSAEVKIATQQDQLNRATRLALFSEVSMGIAHQIGQPLTAMGANLSIIANRLRNCTLQSCHTESLIAAVEADVERMRGVINHLRALANPNKEPLIAKCINDLVKDAVSQKRLETATHRIVLIEELSENLPTLQINGVQIEQVVLNLIQNAIDAIDALIDGERIVAVRTYLENHRIVLAVRDSGEGISTRVATRLFLPFFSTKSGGMGIGLPLCETLVHLHQGSIEYFNNGDGPGSTFRVLLPIPPT